MLLLQIHRWWFNDSNALISIVIMHRKLISARVSSHRTTRPARWSSRNEQQCIVIVFSSFARVCVMFIEKF
jgi:adenosyl cobinamide kinase/adenosyl cobinamide phosphate guanylyltransferase